MHTIRTLREREKEGQRAARERDEAVARLRELEDAQKSEAEKQAEELNRLRGIDKTYASDRQKWQAEKAVLLAAPKAGITDTALALAVIDVARIEFDGDQPTNVDEVLADLVEKHPALAGETPKPRPPRTDAREGRTRQDAPKLTADEMAAAEAMNMSPEDYARFKGITSADKFAALAGAAEGKE
jgi:hypothetical protein